MYEAKAAQKNCVRFAATLGQGRKDPRARESAKERTLLPQMGDMVSTKV
jgi:hypothetical protein